MASLTETAYYTRRTINWSILAVIGYIILKTIWVGFLSLWITLFPPQPAPPNHAFHKLPAVKFPPPIASPSGQLTFTLETIQGTVPKASASAYIFLMPKAAPNFLALTKTQDFARRLNFDITPIQETKSIYRFEDPETPIRKMRYDIVSNNFIVRYNYEQDIAVFSSKNFTSADAILGEARAFLQNFNLYPSEISQGRAKATLLRLIGNQLVPSTSLSQTDAVKVDFYRQDIAGLPVMTPFPDDGLVSIVFSGSSDTKKRIVQFAFTYWPIDFENYATYSLKTSAQAWQELQSGNGFIARYPSAGTTATVRQVYLAYYDSFDPQTYLQPIFVFEGDNGFLGYVPAINPDWVE